MREVRHWIYPNEELWLPRAEASRALAALTIDDVRQMMLDFGAGLAEMEPDRLRIFLRGLVDRVELDAGTATAGSSTACLGKRGN
jgi:hypothetical protein